MPRKLLRIPFAVKNGVFLLTTDMRELPRFVEDATGEILIMPSFVLDISRLQRIETERVVDFLPEKTKLLAQVNAEKVPMKLRVFLHQEPDRIDNCALVEFILLTKQHLRIRPGREANLLDCACEIPSLKELNIDPTAKSINHAYKLISTHFEPHRRSSTGNVFDKVYFYLVDYGIWRPLRDHRENIQQG